MKTTSSQHETSLDLTFLPHTVALGNKACVPAKCNKKPQKIADLLL